MFDEYEIVQRDDLKNQIGLFDYCFHITINEPNEEMTTESIKSLAKWCGENFQRNFVLLRYSSLLVAGGCLDNKNSWRPEWDYYQDDDLLIKYFELRCCSSDAMMFKLMLA